MSRRKYSRNPIPSTGCNGLGNSIGCGPSGLEIEAASDAVDIKYLASEIEVWHYPALECCRIDTLKGNTPTGNKFVLEGGSSGNMIIVITQHIHQSVNILSVEFIPSHLRPTRERFLQQVTSKTLWQSEGTESG